MLLTRQSAAGAIACAGLLACSALALAWSGVLPGGWRLRGLFEPQAARAERAHARHVFERLRAFELENLRTAPGAIVFLGASTIERFPLTESFPGCPVVDRGVAGALASEIERYLPRLLPAARPAAIVLHAGGNDRLASPADPAPVLAAIDRLAAAVARAAPGVPILLCGLLPSTTSSGAEVRALTEIEAGIAEISARRGLEHTDLGPVPLVEPWGALAERFSTDGLHLNAQGYALLAARLRDAGGEVGAALAGTTPDAGGVWARTATGRR